MRAVYTFGLLVYALIIRFSSLFNVKAEKWVVGRNGLWLQLPFIDRRKELFWFHCASLGEFDMALPVMSGLKERFPESKLLVTFFSPSGMEHYHKREYIPDFVSYLPLDTPSNAKRFINHYRPKAVFFVKYEFWSNYIFEAKKQNVKVFSICTLFRENHRFFQWYGGFFRKTLRKIDFFFVQNHATVELLKKINLNNYLNVGDTRFDRVLANRKNVRSNPHIERFLQGDKAWVFGSTWPADEAVLTVLLSKFPNQKMIVAPHEISESHIAEIEKLFDNRSCRFSEPDPLKQVLILNTIGHLSDAYAYAELAYVGGGFSGKLHNILEPSVFGVPVIFGPKFDRFPEAAEFIAAGIGFSIRNRQDLQDVIALIVGQTEEIRRLAMDNLEKNKGAADRICKHLQFDE
jgi:3-deoxy-D-manno-octulosonic-acid transferase